MAIKPPTALHELQEGLNREDKLEVLIMPAYKSTTLSKKSIY
jgi:hypothetical protein